jgi:hypothetical protein
MAGDCDRPGSCSDPTTASLIRAPGARSTCGQSERSHLGVSPGPRRLLVSTGNKQAYVMGVHRLRASTATALS